MNYKYASKIFLFIALMQWILTGCTLSDSGGAFTPGTFHTVADVSDIPTKSPDPFEAEVADFDLGEREYIAASGKTMPFRLQGVIGIPRGSGSFPLILITHGSHGNTGTPVRFDKGLSYLVERLARNGYVALSMDMSSAYLWKYGDGDDKEKSVHIADQHVQSLKADAEGSTSLYPVDLTGKIDFSQIGLCGHSKGGDTIFDIALDQEKKGLPISSLLSVAPAMSAETNTRKWTDANISIVVPEYDGDVISLDGLSIDELLSEKTVNQHCVTLLKKANHNYFNTALSENDALLARSREEIKEQLSAKEQQTFLSHYAVDFFDAALKGKTADSIYASDAIAPNKMYGHEVMCRIGHGRKHLLFDASDIDDLKFTGCQTESMQDSWFYKDDHVLADTLTFGSQAFKYRQLINIRWETLGAQVAFHTEQQNFRDFSTLSLRLIADPADGLNKGLFAQSLSVTLTDRHGNNATVTLPDRPSSLCPTEGRLETTPLESENIRYWSRPSPIMGTDIRLSEFRGVELDSITSVCLEFDQTDAGGILFYQAFLQ